MKGNTQFDSGWSSEETQETEYDTSTQSQAALAHNGVVLLREAAHDAVVDGRRLGCLMHLLIRRIRPAVPAQHEDALLLRPHMMLRSLAQMSLH